MSTDITNLDHTTPVNPTKSTKTNVNKPSNLEDLLTKWIKENYNRPPVNLWRSKIGLIIKDFVQKQGYWKNAPRGNPKQAFRKMRETQMKNI